MLFGGLVSLKSISILIDDVVGDAYGVFGIYFDFGTLSKNDFFRNFFTKTNYIHLIEGALSPNGEPTYKSEFTTWNGYVLFDTIIVNGIKYYLKIDNQKTKEVWGNLYKIQIYNDVLPKSFIEFEFDITNVMTMKGKQSFQCKILKMLRALFI